MPFPREIPYQLLAKASSLGIEAEAISEQFIRGSGKGGQKINKTASCVLLIHRPTGIEVRCQKHREQSKNRLSAYKLLIQKIEERMLGKKSERRQKAFKLRKQKQRRSRRAKEKVLHDKRHHGERKALRGSLLQNG